MMQKKRSEFGLFGCVQDNVSVRVFLVGGFVSLKECHQRLMLLVLLLAGLFSMAAAQAVPKYRSQQLFLPVYSELSYGDRNAAVNLAVEVTIRNLDAARTILVKKVEYLDAQGNVVRPLLEESLSLKPMSAELLYIKESDRSGGKSSGVLIEWESSDPVVAPLVLGVMVNRVYNQAMVFTTSPSVLMDRP